MSKSKTLFSRYEKFIIVILSMLQFTIILDFMVLSPLGAILLKDLNISTGQFGLVVSAYAFSAGISGILSAGFADRFDRKKFLIFFYWGFMAGTAMCALAPNYEFLLFARIVTGIFGGVIGSIGFAIVTDLFKSEVRGRVMGFMQMAFAASQILGIPIGLKLANSFGWHSSFWLIVLFGIPLGLILIFFMKPIDSHLQDAEHKHPVRHLLNTVKDKEHVRAYFATVLLATGGFMMMPFGSAFSTGNLGIRIEDLPLLFGITGIFNIIFGPLIGKFSDQFGRFTVFTAGTLISIGIILWYTRLDITPFAMVVALNVVMFAGITARIISSSALISTVPQPQNRGAFMSINASIQQIAGGMAAGLAGLVVYKTPEGKIMHYEILGYIVTITMILAALLMLNLDRHLKKRPLVSGTTSA